MTDKIETTEWLVQGGKIGCIALSNAAALNALTLEMVAALRHQVQTWKTDPELVMIVLHSMNEKAFCAGGDIKRLAQQQIESGEPASAGDFFRTEYHLDWLLRTFPKPVLVWGDGVVMGAGMGLLQAGSHRVVTERSQLAMPEVSIGFFPDVGAGIFLNDLPESIGLFLGWTGARLSGTDATFLGLADHLVGSHQKEECFSLLRDERWSTHPAETTERLHAILRRFTDAPLQSPWERYVPRIQMKLAGRTLDEALGVMQSWEGEDPYLQNCLSQFRNGSPTSIHIIFRHLNKSVELPLANRIIMEWNIAMNVVKNGDFCEGVRALLIDKDRTPKWSPPSLTEVHKDEIKRFFSDYPGVNELQALVAEE